MLVTEGMGLVGFEIKHFKIKCLDSKGFKKWVSGYQFKYSVCPRHFMRPKEARQVRDG